MRVTVCRSRNQVWNAKIFLCLINLLVNSKETGEVRAERGKEKLICWVLLPAKTTGTKKVELTNSFAYTALASRYSMSRLLTKALKNREQQPSCTASEHLRNIASCRQNDKSITTTSAFTQYLRKKRKKTYLLKFNTYSKLLIIQDGLTCNKGSLKTLNVHLSNTMNFMDASGHTGIFGYLSVFQNILFIIFYKYNDD